MSLKFKSPYDKILSEYKKTPNLFLGNPCGYCVGLNNYPYNQHIAKQLDTKVYFNPYSSWERGLNEHTNGLLRHYLPKQTPLAVFESGIINQQKVALRI